MNIFVWMSDVKQILLKLEKKGFDHMRKGIILYQSKYGATQKYADWLKEEIGYDCIETKKSKTRVCAKL